MEALKTIHDLKAMSGFRSHSFIYQQIKEGHLAQPIKVGRLSRWKESDVKVWLDFLASGGRGLTDTSNAIDARKI